MINGVTAFKLYDTYGFPLELTLEMAEENNYKIDIDGFNEEMKKQKEMARNARDDAQSMSSQSIDLLECTVNSEFIGYDQLSTKSKVVAMFKDGKKVDTLDGEGDIIVDKTVFYAESGGQVGDCGTIENETLKASITNVNKAPHKQHLHKVNIEYGILHIGDEVSMQVDQTRRAIITCNHSCTHLLQSALKKVVGSHIAQAGSFVNEQYLRFDFTHFEKVNEEQLKEIEVIVNRYISEHHPVTKVVMPIAEAKKSGATALFDEKYGDEVRVVTMGEVSKEFCGGCHVNNTQEIGVCKIVSEESIGSGIRRITAKTGFDAYDEFSKEDATLKNIASHLKMKGISKVEEKVVQVSEENASLKKELAALKSQMFVLKANDLKNELQDVNGLKVLVKQIDGVDANALKDIASTIKGQYSNAVVFLVSVHENAVVFVAGAGDEAVKSGIKCGDLVKEAAMICDGKGGGRPDLAQAGGKNPEKIKEAMEIIENKLGISL